MTKLPNVEVNFKKSSLAFQFLICIVFTCLSLWLLVTNDMKIESLPLGNVPLKIMSVVSVVLLLCFAYITLIKFCDVKPAITINELGITDNSSALSVGFISWADILDADIFNFLGQDIVIIRLSDPRKHVESCHFIKKILLKINSNLIGSPVSISTATLETQSKQLFQAIISYRVRYSHNKISDSKVYNAGIYTKVTSTAPVVIFSVALSLLLVYTNPSKNDFIRYFFSEKRILDLISNENNPENISNNLAITSAFLSFSIDSNSNAAQVLSKNYHLFSLYTYRYIMPNERKLLPIINFEKSAGFNVTYLGIFGTFVKVNDNSII